MSNILDSALSNISFFGNKINKIVPIKTHIAENLISAGFILIFLSVAVFLLIGLYIRLGLLIKVMLSEKKSEKALKLISSKSLISILTI